MKSSTKAVLLSLIVCPGIGHISIGHWKRGMLFLIPILFAFGYLVKFMFDLSMTAMDKLLSGELPSNAGAIEQFLRENLQASGVALVAVSINMILLLWVLAAIDAYYLADKDRRLEQ